jgi:tetratricopeptide (TPR) repeat protein
MRRSSKQGTTRKRSAGKARLLAAAALRDRWDRLHAGDREPFPDASRVTRLAKKHAGFASWVEEQGGAETVGEGVQAAWADFHAGNFPRAIEAGGKLGALGATAANKAAAIHSLQAGGGQARALKLLEAAVERADQALELLPDYANAHYTLALALGRYSQRISILQALADGLATRVREHLEATLELEPRHAEGHIALGLYHAEVVSKLGGLMARLTYGATQDAALEHFRRAIKLVPQSPIAHMEYAHGLLLLDARGNRDAAVELYEQAASFEPADAMEELDVERAKRGPS